jgi:predicted RNase H-like nuclease (RuvC/YqgF family)
LQRELQNTTESARAEIEKRIEELNIESAKNQTAMLEVSKKISNLSNEVADLENYIAENEDRISALKTRNQQLEEEREQFESDSRLTKKNIESAHKAQKRLCANLFKNIDYSDNSITVLSSNKIPKKLRRILDLLNDGERNIPGIESCPWHSQKDMWEYKFSDAGRVFVVFVPPAKPLITDIDFNHKH